MKLFIDTANIDEVIEVARWGVLDGVTTNPSLAAEFEAAQAANSRAGLRAAAKKVNDEVYWTGVTDEGIQIVTTKKISGISATPLPRGGLRLTFNPSFDYSSVVKSK